MDTSFIPPLCMEDYTYALPDCRIAKYPLAQRDASQLLYYRPTASVAGDRELRVGDREPSYTLHDAHFTDLPALLPPRALLVFNNTKVIPARLFFSKPTGALIEIFCLEPETPKEYVLSFAQHHTCRWVCVVGNAKRWKGGVLAFHNTSEDSQVAQIHLTVTLVARCHDHFVVQFDWISEHSFAEVLEMCGRIPIPPYLNRDAEDSDIERYQTVYAKTRGSVAAPTAGLHFTPRVLHTLLEQGFAIEELTLHVGAGTFRPVKATYIKDHPMHTEPFTVTLSFLQRLLDYPGPLVSVGTTSCRTLESLYYLGLQASRGIDPQSVAQWEPYEPANKGLDFSFKDALTALIHYMDLNGLTQFKAATQIIIVPGYTFHAVDALITNYHQPGSTLLLLIAAFVGPVWRDIYRHALDHDYRFLSYGDSSLLVRA